MFLSAQRVQRRAVKQDGDLTPFAVPSKGMNARDALSLMAPQFAIRLVNVLCEQYGLRVRKGYTAWATIQSAGVTNKSPIGSVLVYYPSLGTPKIFATQTTNLYNVTAGGVISAPDLGTLSSRYVTSIMFHNATGAFLLVTPDEGGYYIYDGTSWSTVALGTTPGQITPVDPALLCFVMEWKKKVWFVEKDSTRAWYLPTGQITGTAVPFDFGEHFSKGGKLIALANWTVDGGAGIDDYLVAVSSQGDVVIYKGTDPATASTFAQNGRWAIGALPAGRRSVYASGGDVYILSQLGVVPISRLLAAGKDIEIRSKISLSYLIDPLVAKEMQASSAQPGWQIRSLPKEELVLIGLPNGKFLALKATTEAWSIIQDVPYTCFGDHDALIYAGMSDGRIVRAFDGQFDGFSLGLTSGEPVRCEVVPAYQSFGKRGYNTVVMLMRPTFLAAVEPIVRFAVLFDYGLVKNLIVPSLPTGVPDAWDVGVWNQAHWSGSQSTFKRWFGAEGQGVAATVQLGFSCPGDTLLTSIDLWGAQGGAL